MTTWIMQNVGESSAMADEVAPESARCGIETSTVRGILF